MCCKFVAISSRIKMVGKYSKINSIYDLKLLEPAWLGRLALQRVKKNTIIVKRAGNRTSKFFVVVKRTAAGHPPLLAEMAAKP